MCATELINGLHPYPSLRHYFDLDGVVFNDPTVKLMWGNKNTGYRRVESLRKFMRFGPTEDFAQRKSQDIFADVRPMVDMLLEACEGAFDLGANISLDEIDIGTQTSFQGKEKIKFKVEGDGILADAVCDSTTGALITFRFRKDSLAMMKAADPEIFVQAPELSPLHFRCLALLRRPCVRGKWRTAWMDNLFPSLRFAFYLHKLAGVHLTGLTRGNRGYPMCAWQPVIKSKVEEAKAKGTVKRASLLCGTFGVFAISIYDNKPVHVMSTAHKDTDYVNRVRRWYEGGVESVREYRRLRIIHYYNLLMGGMS